MYIGTTLNKDITTHQSYKMKKTLFLLLSLLVAGQVWAESRAEKLRDNLLHNPKYVTVVAHRGDWRSAPENSLQAFQNCIDMGVDMIELDLQRTSDGVLVVMHDRTLDRCSNGKGKISDHTYAELQQLYLKPQHAAQAFCERAAAVGLNWNLRYPANAVFNRIFKRDNFSLGCV